MEQKKKFDRKNKGGRPKKGAAHAGAYGLHPPVMRHGEQPEPACAKGERGWLRQRETGMPCTGRTYRGSA